MLGANATTRTPREPPTRPMTIHGRRMPSFDEVRSLILPKNGLAKIDSKELVEMLARGETLHPQKAGAPRTGTPTRRRPAVGSPMTKREYLTASILWFGREADPRHFGSEGRQLVQIAPGMNRSWTSSPSSPLTWCRSLVVYQSAVRDGDRVFTSGERP